MTVEESLFKRIDKYDIRFEEKERGGGEEKLTVSLRLM